MCLVLVTFSRLIIFHHQYGSQFNFYNLDVINFETLDTTGFGNSNNVFPVYIGDDRTDEDAFKVYLIFLEVYYN